MAWQRRMSGLPGPFGASGEASNENPVQVEMLIGGVWIDITAYVMVRDDSGNISLTRGRTDEGSTTEQSTCQMQLNNRDGRWSPRNPTGDYYGLIGRNQTVRVSVPDGIGGKSYRFWGEVSTWPQGWDPTGTDVWTDVGASGILQRLAQGPAPTNSVLRTALTGAFASTLLAYWPMEDPEGSTTMSTPLVTGSPMTYTATPTLASFAGFPSSDPLPLLTATSFTGGVAKYDATAMTGYQMRYLLSVPTSGFGDTDVISRLQVLEVAAGVSLLNYFDIHYNNPPGGIGSYGATGTLTIVTRDGDEAAIGGTASTTMDVRGRLLWVSLENSISGATLTSTLRVLDVKTGATDSASITIGSTSMSRVVSMTLAPVTLSDTVGVVGAAAGHLVLQNGISAITDLGRALYPNGEPAGRRIQRICSENGIAFDWIGDLDDSTPLGNETRLSPLSIMQEAELADSGILFENMQALGLGYRTRTALCNQDARLTLNYAAFNLSEVPTPVEDDRYIQNQITVTVNDVSQTYAATDGSLSTQLPPVGVGVYGADVSLNLESSDSAMSQAAWRVHLGTVDEPRYPQISVNLAHSSFTINPALKQAVLALRQGDRVVVQNPPSWLPPGDISQIILGFSETITHFEHRITFICAPESPYQVGVLDAVAAVIDTDGSVLGADVASGDTSLYVMPSAGQSGLWTTDSANFPVDVRVGGEVMRVTNITPAVNDTFTRVTANGWGSADTGQAWTASGSAADFATSGTVGTHSLTNVNSSRYTTVVSPFADVDIRADFATSVLAAGGSHYVGLVGRWLDINNTYFARLTFTTAAAVQIVLQSRVGGAQSDLTTVTLSELTHVAAAFYTLRFQITGTTLQAKAWLQGDPETPVWHASVTDTSLNLAGSIGVRSILDAANSNVLPVTASSDNFQLTNPQTFTVSRSQNGIVKAQSAGADLRLANPTIISL